MAEPSRTPEDAYMIDRKTRIRLDEITRPDYEDGARKNLTGWDWVAILGFLASCVVVFVAWGY
jgi:hypothetical protein